MNMVVLRDELRKRLAEQEQEDQEQFDAGRTSGDENRPEDCQVDPPTPRQIRERCAEIQREWTSRERLKRAGYRRDPSQWHPPVVSTGDLDLTP